MHNKTRNISYIICAVLLFFTLAACGEESTAYRDDVLVTDIADAVDGVILRGADMKDLTETYISGSMNIDVLEYEEHCIRICSKGIEIDEYGIFKAKDPGQAKNIKASLEEYLQMRKDTWMPEYRPEEFPKLENAELKVYGNYVMYSILSESEKTAAFSTFEATVS